jgi:hypothetical protein
VELEKYQIYNLIRKAQRDYYVHKIIDQESFSKIEEYYNKVLAVLDLKDQDFPIKKNTEQDNNAKSEITSIAPKKPNKISVKKHKSAVTTNNTVAPDKAFILNNGAKISSLEALKRKLAQIDKATFAYHVNDQRNDFANWVKQVFKNENLADLISQVKTKQELIKILEDNL